jgi:hypothetical protein
LTFLKLIFFFDFSLVHVQDPDKESESEPETGDVKQDAVADLYDYRKARVTPLGWPAYKWPSIPELVESPTSGLGQRRARRRRPRARKCRTTYASMPRSRSRPGRSRVTINGRATTKDDNSVIRVDGRIWVSAQRLT